MKTNKRLPLVSINVRTFNSGKTIGKTLESIRKQTYKNIELLVSDSYPYSKDDTVKIAKKYKAKINFPAKNEDPRVENYKKSRGKYIFSVDSDQILDPNLVKECVEKIQKEKIDAITISERSLIVKNTLIERLIAYDKYVIDKNQDDDIVFGTARPRFFKKELLKNVKWPLKFSMFDDTLLYDDLLSKNAKFAYLNTSSIWHHEVTSWKIFIKKFHKYGKSYAQAFVKKPGTVVVQSLPRRSYFSKAAFDKPLYFFGLLILYMVKMLASLSGALSQLIQDNKKFVGVLALVIAAYLIVFRGFFQQDEWSSFAFNYGLQAHGDALAVSFGPTVGHYQPFNTMLIYILFSIFGINYTLYAFISLGLHLLCITLVFVLLKVVFKKYNVALVGSLLFGLLAANYQTTSWILADLGIHLSTLFALLSSLVFVMVLKTNKLIYLIYCLVFLIISLLFKETALAMFLVYPIWYMLFAKKIIKKYIVTFIIIGGAYFLIRVGMTFFSSAYTYTTVATQSQSLKLVIYNIASYPIKAFSQSIIPSNVLFDLAKYVASLIKNITHIYPGTTEFDVFAEKRVMEVLSYLVFGIFMLIIFRLIKRNWKSFDSKILLASLIFIILNSFIYGLAPERVGIITDVDSRNLYFISIGVVVLIILVLKNLLNSNSNKLIIGLCLILFINLFLLEQKLVMLTDEGYVRKKIVNTVLSENKTLPNKVIFYTQSNKTFYGLPDTEKILPFQSGFGHTLLVLYYKSQNLPIGMFDKRFLWDIGDQGYKEINGKGFGYFRDLALLKKIIVDNKLSSEDVIAYKYNSDENIFINITDEIRSQLKNAK